MAPEFHAWASTDVGRVRLHNEDCYLMDPELGLFLVANDRAGKSDGHTSLPMQWIHLDRR